MSSTSLRAFGSAVAAAALLGAGSFIAPAVAQAQFDNPIQPSDILKIDSPDLTVNVSGDTANFTVTAPENMACLGPLIVEGSISEEDIDPETADPDFFDEFYDEVIWPTEESDLHVVVNESSDLAEFEEASVSPHRVSVPGLEDGDYVASTLCVTEDNVAPMAAPGEITTFQAMQFPAEVHFRNFSVVTTGSVDLGSVDVMGSLGSLGS